MTTLLQFLQSTQRNAWTEYGTLEVYMRRDSAYIDGALTPCLTMASVVNNGERGKGQFWRMLDFLREQHLMLRIEQVLNPQLAQSLRDRGWYEYQPLNFVWRQHD